MPRQNTLVVLLAGFSMLLSLVSCASYVVMPTHQYEELKKLDFQNEVVAKPALKDETIVLSLMSDRVIEPIGAYHEYGRPVSSVAQLYVMPNPGFVLFESVAKLLERSGYKVYRFYGVLKGEQKNLPPNASVLMMQVDEFELHLIKTTDDEEPDHYLARAKVTWFIDGGTGKTSEAKIKLRAAQDPLPALAGLLLQDI